MSSPDPVGAIQALRDEHVLILRALDALDVGLRALQAGAPVDRPHLERLVGFFRVFADRRHHGKEEGLLFPLMVERLGFPWGAGPIAVLSRDHQTGRALLAGVAGAVARLEADAAAPHSLLHDGRAYVELLRAHIAREDDKVFPTVEDLLEPGDAARLAGQFAAATCGGGGVTPRGASHAAGRPWAPGNPAFPPLTGTKE
jgi:hemerythrin-like domain-containing protein